jgi:tRNA (cytidine/uridine-2'-O-)-methyltransferase
MFRDQVTVAVHGSWGEFEEFFQSLPGDHRLYGFSKLGRKHYGTAGLYTKEHTNWLMFGAETTGLPAEAVAAADASGGALVKIPMSNHEHVRSLNLSTSVGVGIYEALRQLDGAILPEDVEQLVT